MNKIIEEQNKINNLRKLAAADVLYEKAKLWSNLKTILSVPLIIILSIITLFSEKWFGINIDNYIVVVSLVITALTTIFIPIMIKKYKHKASLIQELFDCNVLGIKWNNINIDSKPAEEDISRYSNIYLKQKSLETKKNWYPNEVSELPEDIARIICQRTNCWWDYELRERINVFFVVLILFFAVALIFIGCIQKLDFLEVLTKIISPFIPYLIYNLESYNRNKETIILLKHLKTKIDDLVDKAKFRNHSNLDLIKSARGIQDNLLKHRKNNFIIPTFLYNNLKSKMEESMKFSAKTFC